MGIVNGQKNRIGPTIKSVAAVLAGVVEDEILAFGIREDGSAVVVKSNGQKLVFTSEQIDRQAKSMLMTEVVIAAENLDKKIEDLENELRKIPTRSAPTRRKKTSPKVNPKNGRVK